MIFSNKNNQITVKGMVYSDIKQSENNANALTFSIKIFRPAVVGKEQYYDVFEVYACDKQNINIINNNLTTGICCKVKGELRIFFDGTYKICAAKIEPIW